MIDISYNEKGITINGVFRACANPRLEFARELSKIKQSNEMRAEGNNTYHERCVIGKIEIGTGCVIGGQGFGYCNDETGALIPMPHLGRVVIEDNVTIHNNVNIDRGVIGDTLIGEGTKIDSLVHIAHNVKIGRRCLIVAGAVLGGSSEIGDYSFIGMGATIKQKVKVGKNCVIGQGAVVTKDVPDNQIWIGNPAKYMKDTEPRNFPL